MKIQVTQTDIDKANKARRKSFSVRNSQHVFDPKFQCPIAQAIKRMHGKDTYAEVMEDCIYFNNGSTIRTSKRMKQFIKKYDSFQKVTPKTFILTGI